MPTISPLQIKHKLLGMSGPVLHKLNNILWLTQGWSKFYDFSFSHLRSGMHVIEGSCQHGHPQWQQLRGLLGTAIYGGVIDDAHDFQARRDTLCAPNTVCNNIQTS